MPQATRPTVRVLQSVPRPHERQNPFVRLLSDALPAEVQILWFSWRAALVGHYDLVHAHWPEIALRSPSRVRRMLKQTAFALWLTRLAASRIPVVRTVHNARPHEASSRFETLLLRRFDRLTALWITLNEQTATPNDGAATTIPHGHYRDLFAGHDIPATVPYRLLFFGLIRPYKGVPELLDAFTSFSPRDVRPTMHVVGDAPENSLREAVRDGAMRDPRVVAQLAYVDDALLAREIGEAQVVVLPYHDLLNSGSLLLALSLDRPVLVPTNPVTAALRAEVGEDWVIGYEPPLKPTDLAYALERSTKRPTLRPNLSAREWRPIGEAHYQQYLAVLGRSGS